MVSFMIVRPPNDCVCPSRRGRDSSRVTGDIVKHGAIPKPPTLRRMAEAMSVPLVVLHKRAGHLRDRIRKVGVLKGVDESLALFAAKYPNEYKHVVADSILPAIYRPIFVIRKARHAQKNSRR